MHQTLLERQLEQEEKEKVCTCCTSRRLTGFALFFTVVGLTLALVATFVPGVIQHKLESGIEAYVSLAPSQMAKNSEGFTSWADTSSEDAVPVYHSVYMFNITNPEAILSGAHPSVTQHGPYTYRESKKKFDFTYTGDYDNRQVLQYKEWTYWEFQSDLSAAGLNPLTDKYTMINVPVQAFTNALPAADLPLFWSLIEAQCPGQYTTDLTRMFTNKVSVDQILFGFPACVLSDVPASGLTPKANFPGLLGPNLPPSVNNTEATIGAKTLYDAIYTGEDDPDFARQYYIYQEQTFLVSSTSATEGLWGSPAANRVYGTAGDMFKRNVKDNSTVVAFVTDLLRHAPLLNLDSIHSDLHGIDLVRYTLDPKILLNDTYLPSNADYYMGVHNGLLDLSRAKQGLPLFISKPHFLSADKSLQEDIIGMHPEESLHDTFLDVEPLTGVTMRAHKRLQLNIRQQPMPFGASAPWYANITLHYTPVAWIDENAEITSSKASSFKSSVYGALDAIKYVRLLGAIFGAVAIAVATHLLIVAAGRTVNTNTNAEVSISSR